MAGYIFLLNDIDSLNFCIRNGVYSTIMSQPNGKWRAHHEATFADYVTMKEGDNIYFFIKRKIYGIGELVNVAGQDCKFSNYPGACLPVPYKYGDIKDSLFLDSGPESANFRWICFFKPSPHFFIHGVDMDEVLSSNPSAFRMIRALQKVSFIKFDDEENQAFKDVLLKNNQEVLGSSLETRAAQVFIDNHEKIHAAVQGKLSSDYKFKIEFFLESCSRDNFIEHEMAIEAGLLYQIAYKDADTINIFGEWDYLSHQVIASPFKPIHYMDKMDVFGYSYITGHAPTKSAYFLVEIKKDAAIEDDIEQALKYVDWIKDEYCFNDYSMINAFVVAYSFDQEVINYKNQNAIRQYAIGRRPAKTLMWNNLKLVKYSYNDSRKRLDFDIVG